MAATETSAINAVSTINATVIFPLPDEGTVFFIVPVTDSPSNPIPMGITSYRTSTVGVISSTIYLVNYIFL